MENSNEYIPIYITKRITWSLSRFRSILSMYYYPLPTLFLSKQASNYRKGDQTFQD